MNNKPLTLRSEVSSADVGALVCDVVMLAIFLWNQLYYGMDMLFLIIPLALIGVYLAVFCVVPEAYCFAESALEITHPLRKTVRISYETVFNFDAVAHDSFVNILQGNRVKLYHTVGKTKKLTICRPRDIIKFTDMLKQNCPEFQTEATQRNRLEVFFENDQS